MITTRDIKVFIFSVLFSTVCYALFNQPLKLAEAQGGKGGGGLLAIHAEKAREIHNDTYGLLQTHISGAIANHARTQERLEEHISGAIANHALTQDRIDAHINVAAAKHDEMLEKLDALLAR